MNLSLISSSAHAGWNSSDEGSYDCCPSPANKAIDPQGFRASTSTSVNPKSSRVPFKNCKVSSSVPERLSNYGTTSKYANLQRSYGKIAESIAETDEFCDDNFKMLSDSEMEKKIKDIQGKMLYSHTRAKVIKLEYKMRDKQRTLERALKQEYEPPIYESVESRNSRRKGVGRIKAEYDLTRKELAEAKREHAKNKKLAKFKHRTQIDELFSRMNMEDLEFNSNETILDQNFIATFFEAVRKSLSDLCANMDISLVLHIINVILTFIYTDSYVLRTSSVVLLATTLKIDPFCGVVQRLLAPLTKIRECFVSQYVMQSGIIDTLKTVGSTLDKLLHSDFTKAIRTLFVGITSYLSFPREYAEKVFNIIGTSGLKMSVIKLIQSTLTVIVKIAKGASLFWYGQNGKAVPISELLFGANIKDDLKDRFDILKTFKDSTYSGLPVPMHMCQFHYMRLATEFILTAETFMHNIGRHNEDYPVVREWLVAVSNWKLELAKKVARARRIPPLAVLHFGEPGVGKSLMSPIFLSRPAVIKGYKYNPTQTFFKNPDDEFWEPYSPLEENTVFISEIARKSEEQAKTKGDDALNAFLSCCDSNPFNVSMAFEGKGKTPFLAELIVMDSNNEQMNLKHLYDNPSAFRRRLLAIEQFVLPEYRKDGGSCQVDPDKVRAAGIHILAAYRFNMFTYVPKNKQLSDRRSILTNVDYLACVNKFDELFVAHQRHHSKVNADLQHALENIPYVGVEKLPESYFNIPVSDESKQETNGIYEGKVAPDTGPPMGELFHEWLDGAKKNFQTAYGQYLGYVKSNKFFGDLFVRIDNPFIEDLEGILEPVPLNADKVSELMLKADVDPVTTIETPETHSFKVLADAAQNLIRIANSDPQFKDVGGNDLTQSTIDVEWSIAQINESKEESELFWWCIQLNTLMNREDIDIHYMKKIAIEAQLKIKHFLDEVKKGVVPIDPPSQESKAVFQSRTEIRVHENTLPAHCWNHLMSTFDTLCDYSFSFATKKLFPDRSWFEIYRAIPMFLIAFIMFPEKFFHVILAFIVWYFYPILVRKQADDFLYRKQFMCQLKLYHTYHSFMNRFRRTKYRLMNPDEMLLRTYKNYTIFAACFVLAGSGAFALFHKRVKKFLDGEEQTNFSKLLSPELQEVEEKMEVKDPRVRIATSEVPFNWNLVETLKQSPLFSQSIEEFQRYIISQTFYCYYKHGDRIGDQYCFGLKDNIVLINTHFHKHVREHKLKVFGTTTGKYEDKGFQISTEPGAYIDLGNDITLAYAARKFKDNLQHIQSGFVDSGIAYIDGRCVATKRDRGTVTVNDITYEKMYYYVGYQKVGYCGNILVTQVGKRCVAIGMHAFGQASTDTGFSVPLEKNALEQGCKQLLLSCGLKPGNSIPTNSYALNSLGEMHINRKSPFCHIPLPQITYYGTYGKVNVNNTSRVKENLLKSTVPTIEEITGIKCTKEFHAPMLKPMKIGEYVSPQNNILLHFTKSSSAENIRIFRIAKKYLKYLVKKSLILEKIPLDLHPYPIEHAINGSEVDAYLKRINVSTAAGFMYPGKKEKYLPLVGEKIKLFDINSPIDFTTRMPNDVCMEGMHGILESYLRHEMSMFPTKMALKDEVTSMEKFLTGKTRPFEVSSLPYFVLSRSVLAPITTLIQQTDGFGSMVGINIYKDADRVYKKFTRHPNYMESDIQKFDITANELVRRFVHDLFMELSEEGGYNDFALMILRGILDDSLNPLLVLDGDIFMKSSIPSGQLGTAEINCVVNKLFFVGLWVKQMLLGKISKLKSREMKERKKMFSSLPEEIRIQLLALKESSDPEISFLLGDDVRQYDEEVDEALYGDDSGASVSDAVKNAINNHTLRDIYAEMGMVVTSSDKALEMSKFVDVKDATFLKRSFKYSKTFQRIMAPLETNSIYKMTSFSVESDVLTEIDHIISVINSALPEWMIHLSLLSDGRKEYDEIRRCYINTVRDKTGVDIDDRVFTYERTLEILA